MKKTLLAIALVTILFTIISATPIYAAGNYEANLKIVQNERTDEYVLDYHKNKWLFDNSNYVEVINQAKIITAGITDDYAKVKAIHDWVSNNVWYDIDARYDTSLPLYIQPYDVLKYKRTVCEGYARLTVALLQASDFPAKLIHGELINGTSDNGHAWTEVWVNGRWVFIDTTADSFNAYVDGQFGEKLPCKSEYFDMSLADYSREYNIDEFDFKELDRDVWTGSLYFYDIANDKILKEIKNFPLNGLVTETYGFDINDLYNDNQCTDRFKLNTMRVDSTDNVIVVNVSHTKTRPHVRYNVVDPQGYMINYEDSFYTNFDYNYGEDGYYKNYYGYINKEIPSYLVVPVGELLKEPVDPVLKDYTFIGWYNIETGKKWNFATDKFTTKHDGMILQLRWEKATKSYTVTFNTNKGTVLKPLVIAKDSRLSSPKDPMREGYIFTGWYKDAKCTTKWNFDKDRIKAATTLHAGWEKTYTITYNSNGGTGVFDVIVRANTVASKPIETKRSGYIFLGWYKDAKCTKPWDFATDKVTANTTLYAGWKKI